MTDAQRLVEEIGRELGPTEQEIRHHPYLTALEAGRVRREELPRFAGEQYHIIRSDLRSVALLVNRFGTTPSGPFFQAVLGGETAALAALAAFAAAVGMDDAGLEAYEPAPGPPRLHGFHGLARPLRIGGRGGRRLPGKLRGVGCQLRPDEPRPSRPLRAHREARLTALTAGSALAAGAPARNHA
jgi:hypothetical protein